MVTHINAEFPAHKPVVLLDYRANAPIWPESNRTTDTAARAESLSRSGNRQCLRELNDPQEQKLRFRAEMAAMQKEDKPASAGKFILHREYAEVRRDSRRVTSW
jgi:elongation factor P--beta-lysine ligase